MTFERGQAEGPLGREVWRVAAVVVLGAIGSILATTSINVALEQLTYQLRTDIHTVQWVATGYLLGLAATISTTGWLVRRVGARTLYLVSLLLFATASVLCAAASSIGVLIVFRVVQGIAGGATMPVGMMMLATVAGPERMGRVMSIVGVPLILGPVLGPTLGGVLIEGLSWHWIFLMNVPLSLTAFVLGLRLLPQMSAREAGPFDAQGFVLMTAGAPALVFGLARTGQTGSLRDPLGLVMIVLGAGLIGAFVVHALRTDRPLLDVRLWKNAGFAACAMTALLVSGVLFGTMLLLPLSFQVVRDASAVTAGLLLIPQGTGAAISIAISGRLTDRVGGGRVAVGGIVILTLATAPFVFVDAGTPTWVICVTLFIRGLGMGGSIIPAMAAAYVQLRPQDIPDATPQLNVLQRIGGAMGTTILTLVLASQLPGVPGGIVDVAPERAAGAFNQTFAWALGICLLALVPAIRLAITDRRPRTPNDIERLHEVEADVEAAAA